MSEAAVKRSKEGATLAAGETREDMHRRQSEGRREKHTRRSHVPFSCFRSRVTGTQAQACREAGWLRESRKSIRESGAKRVIQKAREKRTRG